MAGKIHQCTACGRVMPYLESTIGGKPYCHPDYGMDCYKIENFTNMAMGIIEEEKAKKNERAKRSNTNR